MSDPARARQAEQAQPTGERQPVEVTKRGPAKSRKARAVTGALLRLQKRAGNQAVNRLLQASSDAAAQVNNSLSAAGKPLEAGTRQQMEARFGADFSQVRVHTDPRAAEAAQVLGAEAFTAGQEIGFGQHAYDPRTSAGQQLIAHELAHVVQQGNRPAPAVRLPDAGNAGAVEPGEAAAESAGRAVESGAGASAQPAASPGTLQLSPAKDLIDQHKTGPLLDEEKLGSALLATVNEGNYQLVADVLNELDRVDRDDVASVLVPLLPDAQLDTMAHSPQGKTLLNRLFDELTSGSAAEEEKKEADRILNAKSRLLTPEAYLAGKENAMIFPYRKAGVTVLNAAPIFARLSGKGMVHVHQPMNVRTSTAFRRETEKLPIQLFTSDGLDLPENQIVGVRLYDEGGITIHVPALYLVQLGNETVTHTFENIGTVAAIGLSLPGAAASGGAAAAGWLARTVIWADRAAMALGTITTILREHRGWIIKQFGDDGREFLQYVDLVDRVVAIYGISRAAVGLGKTLNELRKAFGRWRGAARQTSSGLSKSKQEIIQQVDNEGQALIDNLDQINDAKALEKGSQQAAATGKEGAGANWATVEKPASNVFDIRTGKPVEPPAPTPAAPALPTPKVEEDELQNVVSLADYRKQVSSAAGELEEVRAATGTYGGGGPKAMGGKGQPPPELNVQAGGKGSAGKSKPVPPPETPVSSTAEAGEVGGKASKKGSSGPADKGPEVKSEPGSAEGKVLPIQPKGFSRVSPEAQAWLKEIGMFDQAKASLKNVNQEIVDAVNRFHKSPGFETVIKDYLTKGGYKKDGSRFVMEYAARNFGDDLLKHVVFEMPDLRLASGEPTRYMDIVVFGKFRYEFKSVIEVRPSIITGGAFKPGSQGLEFGQLQKNLISASAGAKSPEEFAKAAREYRWVFDSRKMSWAELTRDDVIEAIGQELFRKGIFKHHPHKKEILEALKDIVQFWP